MTEPEEITEAAQAESTTQAAVEGDGGDTSDAEAQAVAADAA